MNNGNKRILQVYYHKKEICPADSCNGTVKTAGFFVREHTKHDIEYISEVFCCTFLNFVLISMA